MKKDDCIFCKIANGEIPSDTLYEDAFTRVILDLNPASRGHALVLPKEHFADVFELPEDAAAKVIHTAKTVAPAMMKALGAAGMNLVQNNGEAAGQTVRHFHLHLIPRYEGGPRMCAWEEGKSDPEEQKRITEAVKAEL